MATQPGAQSGYLASHSLGKPQMEKKWKSNGTAWGWAEADTGAETTIGYIYIRIPECFHFPFTFTFTSTNSLAGTRVQTPHRKTGEKG